MMTKMALFSLAALTFASPALALNLSRHHAHHRHLVRVEAPQAYDGNWQAEVIARATERAQTEPGLTNELAPDSRQTATGGPVGGVPGYDGT